MVLWLWVTTHVRKVLGSNPGAVCSGCTFGHFFTLICCKHCIVCLKRPKINEKEPGSVHFFLKDVVKCMHHDFHQSSIAKIKGEPFTYIYFATSFTKHSWNHFYIYFATSFAKQGWKYHYCSNVPSYHHKTLNMV